jgi:hypothetical protein
MVSFSWKFTESKPMLWCINNIPYLRGISFLFFFFLMKICIQFLHSLFQGAPYGLVCTSPRHVNVPEISRPSGSSIPSAAETASDLTPAGCVSRLSLVNKKFGYFTSYFHC